MLPDRGGREAASRQLLSAMLAAAPEIEFAAYTGSSTAQSLRRTEAWASDIGLVETRRRMQSPAIRVGTELVWLPRRAKSDRVQVLHSLGNTGPIWSSTPSVITIHDLHFQRFPEIQTRRTRLGLRIVVRAAARRARRIVCPSQATKSDVVELLGIDPVRVDVVPHGPGRQAGGGIAEDELRSRYGLGDAPLVLCPAVGFAYKNLDRLLDAFAAVARSTDAVLVHTGWPAVEGPRLQRRASELGIADRVRFLGWVDDATLEGLYAASTMLVSASIAEGFGLTVLEAMLRGLPVACSNVSALAEVAGDAAESFDPYDSEAIAAAISRVLSDPARRRELIDRGRTRAAGFSWSRAAEATLDVYERALEDGGAAAAE